MRVRYPRGWPPGWGKHPAFAAFLAVLWGAAAVAALYGLRSLAESAADPITATDPLFDRDQLDWIGRGALLLMIPVALVLLWSIFLLVRAVPDFWRTRTTTGELVRARRRSQIFQSSNRNNPRYWYYLALDDGTRPRIRSWRVRRDIYDAHAQGEAIGRLTHPQASALSLSGPPRPERRLPPVAVQLQDLGPPHQALSSEAHAVRLCCTPSIERGGPLLCAVQVEDFMTGLEDAAVDVAGR